MNLKDIMLNETSQSQKVAHCIISFIWHSWKDKKYNDKKQVICCQMVEVGGEFDYKAQESFLDDGTILILAMVMHIFICAKINITEHQKCQFFYILI